MQHSIQQREEYCMITLRIETELLITQLKDSTV